MVMMSEDQVAALIPTMLTLTIPDGDAAYNTAAKVLAKIKESDESSPSNVLIWEKTIPPNELWRWGVGTPALPATMQKLGFSCVDQSATGGARFAEGLLQLRVEDSTGYKIQPLNGYTTPGLRKAGVGVANSEAQADIDFDRQTGYFLPEQGPRIGWSMKLQVYFKRQSGDSAPTDANVDDVYFAIPATRYV